MDGRTWCHDIVDPLLYNCPVFFLISLICRQLLLYCLFLCSSVRIVTLVVFASSFKIDEFLHKMAISFSDLKDEKQNQSFLANWTDCARSSHYLLWLEGNLSAHLTLGSTEPCGRPSASLEFLHSLIPPHYTCCISLCCSPRHNIRRRSLSMLMLSSSDTHNLNGYMGWCECHKILIALALVIEVFCLDKRSLDATEILSPDDKRSAQRWQWNTNWRHQKLNPNDW